MADLWKMRDTQSFIASWRSHYGDTALGRSRYSKFIARIATEQRANYQSCVSGPLRPTWCNHVDYRKCVELLEKEAKRAASQEESNA